MNTYYLNTFTKITTNKPFLKRMQVWDVNHFNKLKQYSPSLYQQFLGDIQKEWIKIDINIILEQFDLKDLYENKTQETGYFNINWEIFYRNCFSIANIKWGEIYYSGFFPLPKFHKSNMYCKLDFSNPNTTKVEIKVTPWYLFESRWRLARNQSFEGFLNDLILDLAIYHWKIPMHSAAIEVKNKWLLFMWLPNTGKTTTSNWIKEKLKWDYISEDITFVDINTLRIYSSPFTTTDIIPTKFVSDSKLANIITLYRDNYKRDYYTFVESNNLYEFTFLKDLNIKALFLYGSKDIPALSELEWKYLNWVRKIVTNTTEISTLWIPMEKYIDYISEKI